MSWADGEVRLTETAQLWHWGTAASESRPVLWVRCEMERSEPVEGRWTERLTYIRAAEIGTSDTFEDVDPDEFWRWAKRGRCAVLILSDPWRDLAAIGIDPVLVWDGEPLDRPYGRPDLFMGELRSAGGHGFDVFGLANIHPLRTGANALGFTEGRDWLEAYGRLIERFELGPRWKPSIGMQAEYSLRRHFGLCGQVRSMYRDTYEDSYRFCHEVYGAQGPVQHSVDGHYEQSWPYDFNSFYPSLMTKSLPHKPDLWCPNGSVMGELEYYLGRLDRAVMADVTVYGERALLTTPDLRRSLDGVTDIHRMLVWYAAPVLQQWALAAWRMRKTCEPSMVGPAKTIANALWGRLSRHSRELHEAPDPLEGAVESRWGTTIYSPDLGGPVRYDDDGTYFEPDLGHPSGGWFKAIGAHVLASGALAIRDLIAAAGGLDHVAQAHTDSVWLSKPLEGCDHLMGDGFGQLGGGEPVGPVDIIDGARYVRGRLDASSGGRRREITDVYDHYSDSEWLGEASGETFEIEIESDYEGGI